MNRFQILKGIEPPEEPLKYYLADDDFYFIIIPSKDATRETADSLYKRMPKPYVVFVSDELLPQIIIDLVERTKQTGFLLAKKPLPIFNDHKWTAYEMDRLNSYHFNFIKFFMGEGFQIWSDNIIGSFWGTPSNNIEIANLSTHRILRYIDKGSTLYGKFNRAHEFSTELTGNPTDGFIIRAPFTPYTVSFEEGRSSFVNASVAQLEEHDVPNVEVPSSSLGTRSIRIK